MYRLEDEKAAVSEVQKYLHLISDVEKYNVPRISIDGVYGEETAAAVTAFQLYCGLEPTGAVDLETFDLLFYEYDSILTERRLPDHAITNVGFPLTVGSQGADVINLHLYVNELSKEFNDFESIIAGSYYSEFTENAVKRIQEIFGYEITGDVNKFLYQRILDETDTIRRREEKYL